MDYFRKKNKPLTDEELQEKITSLSPELQAEFLRATDIIMQKESEMFLEILRNSRNEINEINNEIKNGQNVFKTVKDATVATRMLKSKASTDKLVNFVEKRQKNKKTTNIPYNAKNKENEAVENYLKAVGRSKENKNESNFDNVAFQKPNVISRPGTAYKMKLGANAGIVQESIDDSEYSIDNVNNISELSQKKDELISKMKEQDTMASTERERQKKLLEKKKSEHQNKKTDASGNLAANLIDTSREVDQKQLQHKLQQEKIIQERLEKMKKSNVQPGMDERTATMIEEGEGGSSLYGNNELRVRPQTGDIKSSPHRSPRRSHRKEVESIEMQSPNKTIGGWESNENRDVASIFQVNERESPTDLPQQSTKSHKKKHHKKHHKKEKAPEEIECEDLDF